MASFLFVWAAAVQFAPLPSPWPGAFKAVYMSNITDLSLGGNGSAPVLDPHTAVAATIHYDYTAQKAQVVIHDAGADECVRFYNSSLPCTTLMNSGGMVSRLSIALQFSS